MRSGLGLRYRLLFRLWLRSPATYGLLIAVAFCTWVACRTSHHPNDIVSTIYESMAVLWLVICLQWTLSVDFDSKHVENVFTYPIKRWRWLWERLLFGSLLFSGILVVVTACLTPTLSVYIWKSLLFVSPVYLATVAVVGFGTVAARHSLGGMLLGLLYGVLFCMLRGLLGVYSGVILHFDSVSHFAVTGVLLHPHDGWIVGNRLFFLGLFAMLAVAMTWWFARKER
jgi:hypothetical protein